MKPFFSIIIPTLNEQKYLPRLLGNLVKQKRTDFEVIVVDGQSRDKTVMTAQAYVGKLPIITIVADKSNVSRQRNLGAQKANGEFLVFFDADVQIPTQFLKRLKDDLIKTRALFATTYVKADGANIYDQAIANFLNYGMELLLFIDKPFVAGFNFIVARNIFTRVGGFREEIFHAEDYDLTFRLYQAGFAPKFFKSPKLIFSLRRLRQEGRLSVLRKNAIAGIHVLTRGPITEPIFTYPMGGGWYRTGKQNHPISDKLKKAEKYVKRLVKLLVD